MLTRPDDAAPRELSAKLKHAMSTLLEAFDYAIDTGDDCWEFAVQIRELQAAGLNESDLRWLVRKGLVLHAREVTLVGDNGRKFQPVGNLTFVRRTCFVLSAIGVEQARRLESDSPSAGKSPQLSPAPSPDLSNRLSIFPLAIEQATFKPTAAPRRIPTATCIHWDAENRKLDVRGIVVKRFKWQAPNQEIVLSAFQEEGWPERIDDPLPPQPDQDSKRRLSDTIKCLNRKQINSLIHFHGDGTGEGIFWELLEPR